MQDVVRERVRLAFKDDGRGDPPLVLIHGWSCDSRFFGPQLEHFSQAHRVLALDLRGHGQSGCPRQDYTMALFAEDVAWLCERLEVRRPVLVGHSMGGVVAFELAAGVPELPAAIVALDAPMVLPPPRLDKLRSFEPRTRAQAEALIAGMFLPTDDPSRREWIVAAMTGHPRHVMLSAWRELYACASASAETAQPISVPLLAVASAGGHMADLARLRDLCPRLVLGQTVGAGHFHQLEVPDQVNAMIERFLLMVCQE